MGNLRGRRSRRHCLRRWPLPIPELRDSSDFNPGGGMPQGGMILVSPGLVPVIPPGLVPVMPPVASVLPPVVTMLPPMEPVLSPMAPAPTRPSSQVRQNYHPNCKVAVNRMINLELYASYVYLSLAFYMDRQNLALKHFAPSFLLQSREAMEHAEMLMWLQNLRGGRIRLCDIRKPDCNRWENGLKALKSALHLDRTLNQSLLNLHQLSTEKRDVHLCDYLEHHYLPMQVKALKELGNNINNLCQMGAPESGLADYLFDKLTLGNSDKKN